MSVVLLCVLGVGERRKTQRTAEDRRDLQKKILERSE